MSFVSGFFVPLQHGQPRPCVRLISMLSIGTNQMRDCQGMSRRSLLRLGSALPFAAGLGIGEEALGAVAPKAKSVMVIFLIGGPSHLDLFDPKPNAGQQYRGPFNTIATKTPSLRFTELVPKLAARSDKFSLIRTNINYSGGHRPAGSIAMTGKVATDGGEEKGGKPAGYQPNFGSVLARARGFDNLPGFISIAKGPIGDGVGPMHGYGGGIWGKRHDPFMISCSESGTVSLPDLKLMRGITPGRLSDRSKLLAELNQARRRIDNSRVDQLDKIYKQAYQLLTSAKTNKAFDLSQESKKTRDRYGKTSFGQSCLLGRRMVEAGVPYVQVNWSQFVEVFYPFSDYGWDTHADNFELMSDWHGPLLDQCLSTLLDDLESRGLLDSTLVLCLGEFGRTPRVNNIGSRDHWHHCYFSLWAGGGVKPGRVIGESDARGEQPVTKPVTPEMVGTTLLELAGVHTAQRASLNVLPGGEVIDELM